MINNRTSNVPTSTRYMHAVPHQAAARDQVGVAGTQRHAGSVAIVFSLALTPVTFSLWSEDLSIDGTVETGEFPPVPADVKITPQTLNSVSEGSPLEAQITMLEYGCSVSEMIFGSITLRIEGNSSFIWANDEISRNKNKLIVRFDRQAVINLLGSYAGGEVTLEVRGEDPNSCEFVGTDTITYILVVADEVPESVDIGVMSDDDNVVSEETDAPESTADDVVDDSESTGGEPVEDPETTDDDPVVNDDTSEPEGEGDTESPSTDDDGAD